VLAAVGGAALLAGCGASGRGSPKAPATNRLVLQAGAAPSSGECGFGELRGPQRGAGGATTAPSAGTYTYDLSGTETVPGTGQRRLPATSTSLVTPTARSQGVSCFGVHSRYSDRFSTSRVYLIRGDDVYIAASGFDTPNFVATILPRPAILAVAGAGTRWSGAFGGRTSGTYSVEILGRRAIAVGGQNVKAVELSSTARFRGEVDGTQKVDTWLAEGRSLVLREKSSSDLRFGGATERLSYRVSLRSLTPGGAGG